MTVITNQKRADWAKLTLEEYEAVKEQCPGVEETETLLIDLLSDLMHLAEREMINLASCLTTAETHYQAERRAEANAWGMECPECKSPHEIDVCAAVWVRVSADGTDVTAADNGDHEWEDDSRCACGACGHEGTVKTFTPGSGG